MKFLTITSAALIAVAGASSAMAQSPLTRDQVRAELFEAVRSGDMAQNDVGGTLNELFPNQYPAVAKPTGKTRAEVKAELAEAIGSGELAAAREVDLEALHQQHAQAAQVTRAQVKAELAEAIRTGSLVRSAEGG